MVLGRRQIADAPRQKRIQVSACLGHQLQEVLQTAMGEFTTCLFSQKSTLIGTQPDETLQWFAVGSGYPLKTEHIPALSASYTNVVNSAKINGVPVTGN